MKPNLKNALAKGSHAVRQGKQYLPIVDELVDDFISDEGGKNRFTRKALKVIIKYAVAIGASFLAAKTGIAI